MLSCKFVSSESRQACFLCPFDHTLVGVKQLVAALPFRELILDVAPLPWSRGEVQGITPLIGQDTWGNSRENVTSHDQKSALVEYSILR